MSQLVRYSIAWVQNSDFLDRAQLLTQKLLNYSNKSTVLDVFRYFLEKRQHWEQGTKQKQMKQAKNTIQQ
jgi:hypothetical protein